VRGSSLASAAKARAFPRGLVKPKLGGLAARKAPDGAAPQKATPAEATPEDSAESTEKASSRVEANAGGAVPATDGLQAAESHGASQQTSSPVRPTDLPSGLSAPDKVPAPARNEEGAPASCASAQSSSEHASSDRASAAAPLADGCARLDAAPQPPTLAAPAPAAASATAAPSSSPALESAAPTKLPALEPPGAAAATAARAQAPAPAPVQVQEQASEPGAAAKVLAPPAAGKQLEGSQAIRRAIRLDTVLAPPDALPAFDER
jgi:hypothetical protein